MSGIIRSKKQQTIHEVAPYYNEEQLYEFLSIAKKDSSEQIYLMFRILAYTGLKKGELHALRWKDIDFSHGTLATVENWKLVFQPPKTRKSVRTLSLDRETLSLIRRWRIQQKNYFSN